MKIATAMFSNMDEFGDEMMDIVDGGIDRRNNAKVLGEHERPTFRGVAIAVCAYRGGETREGGDVSRLFGDHNLSAQHNLKGDIGDTVMPQTTNLDGGPEPIIRPSGIPFQTGWTATSTREETKMFPSGPLSAVATLEACDHSSLSSLYSTYPAISQLPVAEAAQIHESFANGVVFKLRITFKKRRIIRPTGIATRLSRKSHEQAVVASDFRTVQIQKIQSNRRGRKSRRRKRFEMFLFWRHRFALESLSQSSGFSLRFENRKF